MFFDASGKPLLPTSRTKLYDWAVVNDAALPSWLTTVGTSPLLTFGGVDTSRGYCRLQTKIATPASGDAAGVKTAFNVDTSQFEEISFVIYSSLSDGAGGTDHNWNISFNNASGGFYFQNNQSGGATQVRLYPSAVQTIPYELALGGNQVRRKDIGVTIRPRTKEFWLHHGDPYEGAGDFFYNKGAWANVSGQPMTWQVITRTAAQRFAEFSRMKLRLVHF